MDMIRKLARALAALEPDQSRIKRRNARRKVLGTLRAIRNQVDRQFPAIEKPEKPVEPNRREVLEAVLTRICGHIWRERKQSEKRFVVTFNPRMWGRFRGRAWTSGRIDLTPRLEWDLPCLVEVLTHEYAHVERTRTHDEYPHDSLFDTIMQAVRSDWGEWIKNKLDDAVLWNEHEQRAAASVEPPTQ